MFKDRYDAGEKLAQSLKKYTGKKDHIIIGLARGGIVIAAYVSKILHLPLDITIPRKIPAPNNSELAIGALCEEAVFLNHDLIKMLRISKDYIQKTTDLEKQEVQRRKARYLGKKKPIDITNKTIIIIDDGIATGATLIASIKALKAKKVIVAVPVAPEESIQKIQKMADEVIVLTAPKDFYAIGQFYENFEQITDEEIVDILQKF